MKKFKLIASLLLACLIFAACSQNGKDPAETGKTDGNGGQSPDAASGETAAFEASYWDTLQANDFGGGNFTILDANLNAVYHHNMAVELIGEPINDELFNRDRFIEDKYNVNLDYIQIEGIGTGCASLEKSVKSGIHEYDLVISSVYGSSLGTVALNGALYNMIDVPYLSLTSPWWSKMLYENMQFNNTLYYNGGDIYLPSYSQGPDVMMFNKKLFQDRGIEDNLYNMVFEGTWTLDVLERLTKDTDTDLNSDGKIHAKYDFFGLIYPNNPEYISGFVAGAGVKFSTVAEDGELVMNLNTPLTITKIDRLSNMLNKINLTDQDEPFQITFKEGRALFTTTCMLVPQIWLRDMENDYGLLPMPKWDDAQKSYVSFSNPWGGGYIGIPADADIEKSGFLTEAMAYAGYEMLRGPVYDVTYSQKAARDEESARIVDIIIETAYMDFGGTYDFGGTQAIILNAILNDKDFVSAYEKVEARIKENIEKFTQQWINVE